MILVILYYVCAFIAILKSALNFSRKSVEWRDGKSFKKELEYFKINVDDKKFMHFIYASIIWDIFSFILN